MHCHVSNADTLSLDNRQHDTLQQYSIPKQLCNVVLDIGIEKTKTALASKAL